MTKKKQEAIADDGELIGVLHRAPEPPEMLGEAGARAWRITSGYLAGAGLLTSADIPLLERFACQVDYAAELEEQIQEHGLGGPDGKMTAVRMHAQLTNAIKSSALALHAAPYSRIALTKGQKNVEGVEPGSKLAQLIPVKRASR